MSLALRPHDNLRREEREGMNASEFLRLVDSISRERGLSKEQIFNDIEEALIQAARKRFEQEEEFSLTIDHETGEIRAYEGDRAIEMEDLGRIVANVAKQVIIQRLREDERDLLHDQYENRVGTIISGTILRKERGTVIVQLAGNERAEGIIPRDEQIPGEVYRPGATIRAHLHSVTKRGQRVRMVISRTHTEFIRELFESEVPEIADGAIEIKGIVREPGRRTKIAVAALDPRIDPVGSCVGMRGSRISKISDELGGEKIDIIPWVEDEAQFIINSMKPASILSCSYDAFRDRARVVVTQDQLPLAIGKAGQNVRLSARLTRYRIDVISEDQAKDLRAQGSDQLQQLISAGHLEDFIREIFLDNHLNSLSVIAAQTAEGIIDGVEGYNVEVEQAQQLIDAANALLDEEGQSERDEYIAVRERLESEALEGALESELEDEATPEEPEQTETSPQ